MSILIVGSEGSMGKRYQAILRYLKKDFLCVEKEWSQIQDSEIPEKVSGIIIATPTNTHATFIRKFIPYRKPILCEKPIVKDIWTLKSLFEEIKDADCPFQMMYQYSNFLSPFARGESHYNYFRHGSDGLIWDCLQIIGLSEKTPRLEGESPIWDCVINGHRLDLAQMDMAYVQSVIAWLRGTHQSLSALLDAHQKTWEIASAT